MSWDNRVFNINGRSKEMLLTALSLAQEQESGRKDCYAGWVEDPKKGLILLWHVGEHSPGNKFVTNLTAEGVVEQVWQWLQEKKNDPSAEIFKHTEQWDHDSDHDGHNSYGWRVYCEDWGHVGGNHYSVVAVKPVYLWHGK